MGRNRTFFLIFLLGLLLVFPLSAKTEGNKQTLSPERVAEMLRRYVLERSAWRPDQVEIVLRSFTPPILPDGAVGLVVLKPITEEKRAVTPAEK